MKRRMKRRLKRPLALVNLEPLEQEPSMRRDLGQARTELRLLRVENEALRELKTENTKLRVGLAELFYSASEAGSVSDGGSPLTPPLSQNPVQ